MSRSAFRGISIQHLWVFAVLVGIFAFVNTHPIRPHDFWWHMAVGREIVRTGEIPTVDAYSYTMAGQPYPSYKMFWMMEVALYEIHRVGGAALVVFVQSLLVTLTYGLILMLCLRISGSLRIAAFGAFFAACLGFNDWNVRPQTISFLLGALFLTAIYQYRRQPHKGWLAVFPAGMVVWANSHGSFPIGFALLGMWLLDEVVRRLRAGAGAMGGVSFKYVGAPLTALALAAFAALINPRGFGIFCYITRLTGDPVVQHLVPEWAPPSFATLDGTLFYVALLAGTLILAFSPRRPTFFQSVCFLSFAVLSLKTSRGIVWYGLVMAPVLSYHISALATDGRLGNGIMHPSVGSRTLNLAFTGLLVLMALVSLPWFKEIIPLSERKSGLISVETPVRATAFMLRENVPGPVFHAMSFGSYLIWAGHPEYRVFVDGRIELYPPGIWRDYLSISNAQCGWAELLDHYRIRTLMLSQLEQPALVDTVNASSDWKVVFEDSYSMVAIRAGAAFE